MRDTIDMGMIVETISTQKIVKDNMKQEERDCQKLSYLMTLNKELKKQLKVIQDHTIQGKTYFQDNRCYKLAQMH